MFTEKVNKFSDKLNKAPVTVDAPREETRPAWQAAAFASGYRKQRDGGPNFEGAGLYGFDSGTLELMRDSSLSLPSAAEMSSSSSANRARSAHRDDWYGYRFGCVNYEEAGGNRCSVNDGKLKDGAQGHAIARVTHTQQDGDTGGEGTVPPSKSKSFSSSFQRPGYEPKWALPRPTTMSRAQFGYVWAKAPERFMLWTDLWAAVRDAGTSPTGSCGGGDEDVMRPATRGHLHHHKTSTTKQERMEARCFAALQRFAAQGGRDPWNNSFNSRYEDATTVEVGIAEEPGRTIVFESGAGVTGNRLKKHPWREPHRRGLQADIPSKPTLSHILAGGGYALVHLLVAKNCPKALEYLLNQTITTAVGQAPSSSTAPATGAVESGAVSNQPQAFSNRAIPGANTGTAAAAMFGSIAAVASAAASKRASTTATGGNLEVIQKGNEEEKDGVKGKEGTNKWSMAKAAYQQQQGKAREERKDAQGEGNTQEPTKEGGGKKKEDERNRQWFQEVVDVNLMSAQGETPLAIARALGHVACAAVLAAKGADLNPCPHPLSWLDVFRAIADQKDAVAVETVQAFRRQGCRDPDGFGLDYHRMSRREMDEPAHFASSTLVHAAGGSTATKTKSNIKLSGSGNINSGTPLNNDGAVAVVAGRDLDENAVTIKEKENKDCNDDDNEEEEGDDESISGAARAGRQYKGLRGHQWWGYGDETLGWTLAHCAAGRDKPLCLAELGAAGADLTSEALPGGLKRNVVTPLSLATDRGYARCIAVLMRYRARVINHSSSDSSSNNTATLNGAAATAAAAVNPAAFLSNRARVVDATSLPLNVNQWPSPLQGDTFSRVLEHRPWEQSMHRQSLLAANGNVIHDSQSSSSSSSSSSLARSLATQEFDSGYSGSNIAPTRPTYAEIWAAIASEPEPEAFLKLQHFLGLPPSSLSASAGILHPPSGDEEAAATASAAAAHVDPVARHALGRQQLGGFESPTCGFTLGHLCASRTQWRCFALVMASAKSADRGICDLSGRTAFELASDTHALSATCQETANTSANSDLGYTSGDSHRRMERERDVEGKEETAVRWHQVFDEIRDSCNEASALKLVHAFLEKGAVDAHFGYGLNHQAPAGASGVGHTLASLAMARSFPACVRALRMAERPSSRLQGHFTRSKELHPTQLGAFDPAPAQSLTARADCAHNSGVANSAGCATPNTRIRAPTMAVPRSTAAAAAAAAPVFGRKPVIHGSLNMQGENMSSSHSLENRSRPQTQSAEKRGDEHKPHQIPRGKAASVAALSSSFVLG